MSLMEPVFEALNDAGARYLVVGGLAGVLHGFARLTADIDLMVDLQPAEVLKVVAALDAIGMQPRHPVQLSDFADPQQRALWIEQRNMTVLSLWDPRNPMRAVDLFVSHPMSFVDLWNRSELKQLRRTHVRVVSIDDLIALKRIAGRPLDLQDIVELEAIKKRSSP